MATLAREGSTPVALNCCFKDSVFRHLPERCANTKSTNWNIKWVQVPLPSGSISGLRLCATQYWVPVAHCDYESLDSLSHFEIWTLLCTEQSQHKLKYINFSNLNVLYANFTKAIVCRRSNNLIVFLYLIYADLLHFEVKDKKLHVLGTLVVLQKNIWSTGTDYTGRGKDAWLLRALMLNKS